MKQKGARNKSEFYKKYGAKAGKEAAGTGERELEDPRPQKRSRREPDVPDKAQLDEELDAFLAEDDAPPPSPPSKMRSDYMDKGGRTLSERMSPMRAHSNTLAQRLTASLPLRARSPRDMENRRREGDHRESRRRTERPRKTQEDLDAELDAFLNARD